MGETSDSLIRPIIDVSNACFIFYISVSTRYTASRKSWPNSALFDTVYNLEEGAKCLSHFYEFTLGSHLRYTFGGASLGRLRDWSLKSECQ